MPADGPLGPQEREAIFDRIAAEQERGAHLQAQYRQNAERAAAYADLIGQRYQQAPWVPADVIATATLADVTEGVWGAIAEASALATARHSRVADQTPGWQEIPADRAQDLLAGEGPFGASVRAEQIKQEGGRYFIWSDPTQFQDEVSPIFGHVTDNPITRGISRVAQSGPFAPVRGAIRGVTGALQSGLELGTNKAAGVYRAGAGVISGLRHGDFGEAAKALGEGWVNFNFGGISPGNLQATTAGQSISQLLETGEIDAGTGFFVGDRVREQQAQRAGEVRGTQAYNPFSDEWTDLGAAWTVGRGYAATVTEPGSQPYNYLSGAVDAGLAIGTDPANMLGLSIQRLRTAGRLAGDIAPGQSRLLRRAEEAAVAGDRDTYLGLLDEFLDSSGVEKASRRAAKRDAGYVASVKAAAGVLDPGPLGVRRSVYTPRAYRWLLSKEGERVVDWSTEMRSPSRINAAFRGELDPGTAVALAQAQTREDTIAILGEAFSGQVRDLPTAGTWHGRLRTARGTMRVKQVRAFERVPEQPFLPHDDPAKAWRNLNDSLAHINIKGTQRFDLLDKYAFAKASGLPGEIYRFEKAADEAFLAKLTEGAGGMSLEQARPLLDRRSAFGRLTEYATDDIGKGIFLDPTDPTDTGPISLVEMVNSGEWLWDPTRMREVRNYSSQIGRLTEKLHLDIPESIVHGIQASVFKPLALIRPAYLMKVNGEEIVRTVVGSPIRDAVGWIMAVMGHGYGTDLTGEAFNLWKRAEKLDDEVHEVLARGGDVKPIIAQRDAVVDQITLGRGDDYADALVSRLAKRNKQRGKAAAMALREQDTTDYMVRSGNWASVHKDKAPEWTAGMVDELAKIHRDPLRRRIANGGTLSSDGDTFAPGLDGIWDWLRESPEAEKIRQRFFARSPAMLEREGPEALLRRVFDLNVADVTKLTGRHPALLEVGAHGTFPGGVPAFQWTPDGGVNAGRELYDFLRRTFRESDESPTRVKYDQPMANPRKREQLTAVRNWFFGGLYGTTSDKLARSPTFRSFYWQRVEELGAQFTPGEAEKALAKLGNAKLPEPTKHQIRMRLQNANGEHTLDEIDAYAKGWALDETNKLLVNASNRSQFFDIYRTIFPFGEAWREIFSTWMRLAAQKPTVLNSARKVFVAGRDADPGNTGQGFFYEDDRGQYVFNWPGGGRFAEAVTGMNVDFPIELGSTTIGSNVVPGIGWLASFPVASFVKDVPDLGFATELIFPYGDPLTRGEGFPGNLIPPWARKVSHGVPWLREWFTPGNEKNDLIYFNTFAETAAALATSGDYDFKVPGEQERWLKDARSKARILSTMRGVIQATGPGSPSITQMIATHEGDMTLAKLSEELHALQEADYDTSVEKFLERYGQDLTILLAPKTETVIPGMQATNEFARFTQDHGRLLEVYPDVAGYFGPQGGEFAHQVWSEQTRQGYHPLREPNDRLAQANSRRAAALYEQAKDKVGAKPSKAEQEWLRGIRERLKAEFPGYLPEASTSQQELKRQLDQLRKAVDDPEVQQLPVGRSLGLWFAARDKVIEAQKAKGWSATGISTAGGARSLRDWLRQIGDKLVAEDPSFARLYRDVLSREIPEVDDAAAA